MRLLGAYMMQIARFRVDIEDDESETGQNQCGEDEVWDYILENHKEWESGDVKPLYLTNRGIYRDISLIVSSISADAFSEFILDHLTSLKCIKDVWVFNMMEPRLFSLPENLSQNMKRFTLTLKVVPREAPFIYESISKMKPSSKAVITYITYSYHRHGDILISLLAGDKRVVEDFVMRHIEVLKGVIKTEIIPVIKSKNLATPDEWKTHCGQYFIIKDGKQIEDLEVYENWSQSGFE